MPIQRPIPVVFFRLDSGREPVREWLKGLDQRARGAIGADIKTLQIGWPVGMPLVRKLSDNIREARTRLRTGIARTFFTLHANKLVLLHGFIKKSRKTPTKELAIAKRQGVPRSRVTLLRPGDERECAERCLARIWAVPVIAALFHGHSHPHLPVTPDHSAGAFKTWRCSGYDEGMNASLQLTGLTFNDFT